MYYRRSPTNNSNVFLQSPTVQLRVPPLLRPSHQPNMWTWLDLLPLLLLLPLPALVCLSHTVKYYVKLTLYYLFVSTIGTGIIFVSLFTAKSVDNYRHAAKAFNVVRKLFGIHVEVRGQENLDSDEPYILVSNHQSSLDLMGMAMIVPDNCTCLAKKEMKYRAGPFGIAVWRSGAIFIDRLNHEKAVSTMAKTVEIVHREKYKIWIFPEGTRNLGGTLLPFKKGAFHLAVQAQVPVVPVVFSSYSNFFSKKDKIFESGRFTITCLPPIPTKGMTSDDVADLTEHVRNKMVDVFNITSPTTSEGKVPNDNN